MKKYFIYFHILTFFYFPQLESAAVSKSCFHNIRDLRRIHNTIKLLPALLLLISFTLKLSVDFST